MRTQILFVAAVTSLLGIGAEAGVHAQFGGKGELKAVQAPTKWEYRVETRNALAALGSDSLAVGLNKLGAEGWELAAIDTTAKATPKGPNPAYIFRRPVAEKQKTDAKPAQAADLDMLYKYADAEFKKRDANGDGKLNEEEMPISLRVNLAKWDKNGDGFIDIFEYRLYYVAKMQGRGDARTKAPDPAPKKKVESKPDAKTPGSFNPSEGGNPFGGGGGNFGGGGGNPFGGGGGGRGVGGNPDPEPAPKLELRIYPLKHADAAVLAVLIADVLQPNNLRMRVVADPRTKQLLVNGPADAQEAVQILVNRLDVPAANEAPTTDGKRSKK